MIGEGEKKHCVLIKDLNTFMYHHILHHGRKHLCSYCLQAFRTVEKLKCHIKDCFQINGKKTIKMPKKTEYMKLKNSRRETPFMIYRDFESILVPGDKGKQNPNESYNSTYQKHVACRYGYKLVWVDEKFSKSFKSYLG